VLSNVLFVISELKVFLAYMSVFHSTYILLGALGSLHSAFASSLAYLVLYMALVVHFMSIVLVLRGRSLQFLSDLQGLSAVPAVGASFVCVFAAMSGIPPLMGF
jgi:NADH:ubiquinone oxidoreductase subunit 2 (subunit N)